MDDIQQQVNEEEIATFYNKVEEIWPSNEPWYKYTKAQIEKFVHKNAFKYHDYVLNAGSGGYDYNLNCKMHHVDIAAEKITFTEGTVASADVASAVTSVTVPAIATDASVSGPASPAREPVNRVAAA